MIYFYYDGIDIMIYSWKPCTGTFWTTTYIIAFWTGTCGSFGIRTTCGGTVGIWSN
jgi:hypothetical protein